MARDGLYIGEVARQAGVNPRTIRYYEGLGLLDEPPRTEGRYRLYAPEAVERLGFIKKAQTLGLTLEEIREIIGLRRQGLVPCVHVREILQRKISLLDRKVSDLRTLRRRLRALLAEWEARPPGRATVCPHIEAASTGRRRA